MPSATPQPRYQRAEIDKYLAGLPADAGLRDIVASGPVQERLTEFESADDEAVLHQNRYRWSGRTALWATTLGTLVGAVLLLPDDFLIPSNRRNLFGLLQTLALIVTFVSIRMIGKRKYVERWMASRARAERMRGNIFRAIIEAPAPAGAAADTLVAEKYRLVKACHVDDQLKYYDKAIARHTVAASSVTPLRITGYVLSGFAIVLGLLAAAQVAVELRFVIPDFMQRLLQPLIVSLSESYRLQLCLGTIASCLLAHGSARTLMDQDERNAALYRRTAGKIREVLARHGEEVAHGERDKLLQWFNDVRRAMEEEHIAWILARPRNDPREGPDRKVAPGVGA